MKKVPLKIWEYWWFSSTALTIQVIAERGEILHIVNAGPAARKFVGQPLANLERWMQQQGGFRSSLMNLEFIGDG